MAATARPGDYILIQGDFSATFLMVGEALRLYLTPISSTTRRQAIEEHMPTTHVCLISGQPMANLLPLLIEKPEQAIFLVSPEMTTQAGRLEKLLHPVASR